LSAIIPTYPGAIYVFEAKIVVAVALIFGFFYAVKKIRGLGKKNTF